ncbi:hypothetical protein ACM66B_003839 [Microbotryomycetes sp. NB124-2]
MSPKSSSPPSTIVLWVHPRSCSTMFEQSILQRPEDFRVLHEPMGDAWYFGPERIAPRFSEQDCNERYSQYKDATFKRTWDNIVTPQSPARTFSKDMAQYIFNQPKTTANIKSVPSFSNIEQDNPSLIPEAQLLDPSVVHTFLIRTPDKAIPSYHRLCYPGAPTDFHFFDPEEAGYREVRLLYDYLKSKGQDPLVLDSADLLADPENVMKLWCQNVKVEFDPKMLQWNEGTREHFAKWPGWHTSAENSTGVGQGLSDKHITPSNHGKQEKEQKEMPEIVRQTIEANREHYEYLKKFVKRP